MAYYMHRNGSRRMQNFRVVLADCDRLHIKLLRETIWFSITFVNNLVESIFKLLNEKF